MKNHILLALITIILGCSSPAEFNLDTSKMDLVDIVRWDNSIYVSDNNNEIYKLENDSLVNFNYDSIIDIKKCLSGIHLLKAPNDSIFELIYPDGNIQLIENRTDLKSKYFKIHLNETCQVLLEYETAFFEIQNKQFIDYTKFFGFKENLSMNVSDELGYFNNTVFLSKYGGGLFQTSIDSSNLFPLAKNLKVRDYTIHEDQLLIATGYYEVLDNEEFIESDIIAIVNGQINNNLKIRIPKDLDIACLYSDGQDLFLLSERNGFFKIVENDLENIASINLKASNIIPEKFMVDGNLIYLTTFEHGLLIFDIKDEDFELSQIK